ncbi:MAG: hypothetical protein GW949_05615 [Spirochaetales bacterium]|nr:hypothetical protein [Spirochaetales bacterium]
MNPPRTLKLNIQEIDEQVTLSGKKSILLGGAKQSFKSHFTINILYENLITGFNCVFVSMDWTAKEVWDRLTLLHFNNLSVSFYCGGMTWNQFCGRGRDPVTSQEKKALQRCFNDLETNQDYGKLIIIDREFIKERFTTFSFEALRDCLYYVISILPSCDILAVDWLNYISSFCSSDYKAGRKLLDNTMLFFSDFLKTIRQENCVLFCVYEIEYNRCKQAIKREEIQRHTIWKRKVTRLDKLEDIAFREREKAIEDVKYMIAIDGADISEEDKKLFKEDILRRKKEHQDILREQKALYQAEEEEDSKALERLKGCYDISDFADPEIVVSKSDIILSLFRDRKLIKDGVIRMQILKNDILPTDPNPIELPLDISYLRVGTSLHSRSSDRVPKDYWLSILGDGSELIPEALLGSLNRKDQGPEATWAASLFKPDL